jgi:bifunctional N-acetylglucosamine-1-phosphate-uridyltransferase/glucosamine-1-phosphate-acetyltransferase GlmU-like protein
MPKTAYRPLIEPKLRTSVPRKAMREAVQKITTLRKTNPTAYRAMVEKHKGTVIRIVAG